MLRDCLGACVGGLLRHLCCVAKAMWPVRQFWVSLESKRRCSELLSSTQEVEADGELTAEQAQLFAQTQSQALWQVSDGAVSAGFPSIAAVVLGGVPNTSTPGKPPSAGRSGQRPDKPEPKPKPQKRVRPDILAESVEAEPTRPVDCNAVQEEWMRQLLADISTCSRLEVQLSGAVYAKELVTALVRRKEELQAAHAAWKKMTAPDEAQVALLAANLRPAVLDTKRLHAKAQALLREPAAKKTKTKNVKVDDNSGAGGA